MTIWSRASRNAGQLLTATVLTSLSFHLLFARRDASELRARYTARVSILESLISRLKRGERIEISEIESLKKLGHKLQEGHVTDDLGDSEHGSKENLSWKEVILGTTRKREDDMGLEDREVREWNTVQEDRMDPKTRSKS